MRHVDDTFVIKHQSHKEEFFKHFYIVDLSIQFTMEEARPDGSIQFVDILIPPQTNGTFTTSIYRKHTNTYTFNWTVTTTFHPSTV